MLSWDNAPKRATKGSAGYDFESPATYRLIPDVWTTIDTLVSLDDNDKCGFDRWFMLIVPRSGLSNKYGFRIKNTVGIIDMDYRDTIKATVTVDRPYTIQKGERFMQGIILPYGVLDGEIKPADTRNGGFGSTGT